MRVPQHEIRSAGAASARRHGMAVDQQTAAEAVLRFADQLGQRIMVRLPAVPHPRLSLRKAQLAAVDRLAGGHDPGDGAEAGADARAGGVHPVRQGVGKHRRVQLPRLAVGVAVGAGKLRAQQRRAMGDGAGEQFLDETVLAAAQIQRSETGGLEERVRVGAPGMRRRDDERGCLFGRAEDHVRRGVVGGQHGLWQVHSI